MNLLDVLVERNIIDKKEVSAIEKEAEGGTSIEQALVARGVSPSDILSIKGEYFKIPTRTLGKTPVPNEVLSYIPEESATHYGIVPIGIADGVLEVGIIDPDNIDALDALNFISSKIGLPYKTYLISIGDFQKVVERYRGLTGEVGKALTELESELSDEQKKIQDAIDEDSSAKGALSSTIKEDAPVTKIVATVLRYAVEGGASDVHIEPTDEQVKVRFRVDGVLHTSLVLPAGVHRAMVARIKILSGMKLDERRKPQDGRFSATVDGRKIDFRVSTFPAYFGEKVVMRILDREKGFISLADIGFSESNLAAVREAISRPYGMVLISGPTGSGKSTTLYSMLSELDRDSKNVLSLEDPVEYNVSGVTQSQIRPEIGYTFATGLRTTLRQDPDIIMVGEIRDKETAQLAVQAALTGHLVLSTIHTNNAVGVIPRLIDMGVDPYLIAPTLNLAIAQRLVRRLCPDTGKEIPVDESVRAMLDKEFADLPAQYKKNINLNGPLYGLEQTATCPNGTRGRVAVFEVLEMHRDIEHAILNDPSETVIRDIARKRGMLTMKEDAIIKSINKIVPFEEINTVGGLFLEEDSSEGTAEDEHNG
ncbi:hypothetical protein COU17_02565 [Candidatus Kaiserbacteria bacterium CG10_big_fil_rev_8_21_14_0_10_49_17]|uniref:Bacterial type II secretion system protein E domain-containing protein n=1 Tax=Candidatus Kaiserbacteria bacterium CG10_big_fil_rev_8_21_14_0_10_49_17 TaxID=1974609 RepID=A0A2M6WE38_9BACT|nr:MAG: hypothetical protein COU17_02565 [Candidatus Kaiserbacteria bacterium CG10_big_fil_rev_8_21_14_0_10_49_17]